MTIKNARIEQIAKKSFLVIGDTSRYGEGEILFQDWNRKSCENYIKRTDPTAVWTYKPMEVATRVTSEMVPMYVRDLLKSSTFVLGSGDPGYTIELRKPSMMMSVRVWRDQIIRMLNWALRYGAEARLDSIPETTSHKYRQNATVTITDPVMKVLENMELVR